MKILVTGSRGFVGSRLIPRLEAAGHRVEGFDLDTIDICDPIAVEGAVANTVPEAVVHLAAVAFVPDASRDPGLAERVNVGGTRNIIAAVENGAPKARLLVVGSGDQYPAGRESSPPMDEATPLAPSGAYSETKAAAEALAEEAAGRGLDVVRVRAFNHTGPGQEPRFVAPDFARQIALIEAGGSPIMRVGNLDSVRDFLHVDDVIEAYRQLLDPAVPANVYNVASGVGTRIGSLVETLAARAGVEPQIERDAQRWRPTDTRVGDPARLQAATPWRASRDLEETLGELLDYWRGRIRETKA